MDIGCFALLIIYSYNGYTRNRMNSDKKRGFQSESDSINVTWN